MDNNDSRKWLYESLKGKGYDLGSYDEFDSHADEADTRKWLYETARESGFDMGSYEDFDKGIGYRAPRQEETISVNPQTIADTFSATESEYPSLKEMATVSRFAPIDFSQNTEVNAMSPYSVESLGSRLQQLKKDGKLDMIIHQKEERELDRIYSPKKVENETDALENYRGRFRLTERGKFLNEELDGIRKEITDRYTNEYLASDRYKRLSSRYSGKQLNEEIDKDFQQQYGDRISKDMAPYMDAYNQQVFNRYDVGIQDDLTTLAKGRTKNQVADLRRDIEQELEKTQPEINAPAGSAFIPSSAYGAAQRYGNVQSKEQQDRYTSLVAAKNLLDEADDIVNEASKKGNTTFLGGFGRGTRDKGFDVDTWAMGITDTAYGSLLKKAAQKSDRGEELSSEEKKLLEAAAVNMATQAYFSSDLGRGYKAGSTSAQSIPFMLEFALNPVSGSGNAIAKGILKYGAKRFGLKALESSAVKNGLKVGSRLAGDAVAAAGMTATSGLGHVASGAQERMLGDVQFDFNEDGKIRYTGRENQMSDGDAWLRSTLSNTLENQSEMVFNAFKGAGGVVGVPSTGSLFPGIERFSASKAGELYRAIKNNPTYRKLAERTQFHGMPEEYFEEVYNNLVSLPLGEGSWEESTDIDNNIDTFLGVAPTGIVMSMLGLGSVARESYSTRRNRDRFEKTLSQDELSFFKDLKQRIKDGNIEDAREFVKLTLNDEKLTPAEKKEKIRYVYDMLQENTIEAVQNAEIEDVIQKETDDIVNSSNQADGTVTECSRITTNEIGETVLVPGHIVGWMGGTIIENEDGTKSREGGQPIWQAVGSKERITLHEGEFDPESIKSMPVQDMMDATAEMMREEAQKKAEMESKYDLSRINPPSGGTTFTDISGRQITLVDKNPNGGWIAKTPVLDDKGNPKKDKAENLLEENLTITNEDYYDTMQAQLDAQEKETALQQKYGTKVLDDGRTAVITSEKNGEISYDVIGFRSNLEDSGNMSLQEYESLRDYVPVQEEELDDDGLPVNSRQEENSSNLSENQAENETLSPAGENIVTPNEVPAAIGEANPAPEPMQEQKPALPVDEKGNILYHKMPVENTIADLTDGTLDDNEIDGFIAANKAEAGKLLKKVSGSAPKISTNKAKYLADKKAWQEKVADAQARVDYWNSIGEEIAASRVQPGDKTAEAILSMGEPMNGEELAAMMLGTGRLPILYDSYKKETGGRNTEARGMVGLFATKAKGGLSIEEAGELLMLADQENGTHFFDENDPNAGRNTIIDVLSGARTRGDLFGFIQRNREVMAERERQAELEAYEQTIARLAEASHMTPEEFIAFEENIAQMLEERLKDIPDEELKSIFAELYLDENYGRSRESDEVGTGVPEGEGRAESNEGSPGVLSEEWGDNAGASEYSEERPELDDEIEQSGDGILLEADAVDGREEIKFTPPTQIGGENLLDYAARVVESKRVHDAGSEVDTNPTEAQKEAGNYKKGHVKIDGFDITIENPKGSVRSGVDADGRPWSVTMNNTYGYIRGTEGVDGDHIDVFLGDSGNKVYVVDQLNTETEAFDEHKVMYGFNSMDEATEAYLSNYSPGWQGLGAISEVSKESFKKWIDSSHRKTKPFVDYKSVKVENGGETVANLPESNPIASSKKSELGIEIPAMTEEEYIASEGYGFSGIGDVALHKGKQRTSKQQDKIVESQAKKDEDYARHREILRKTYRDKLSKGELREPSTIEKLLKTANGNPDNESTQAARRTLQKRGIDWQETSIRFRETDTSEEQAIIEKAKEDGTYLKAPNGKPTNLNEKQWAQVRTKAFKRWFGDWEKAVRVEKLRKSKPIKITGEEIVPSSDLKVYKKNALEYGKSLRGEYTNRDTGELVSIGKNGIKEVLHHDFKNIEQLQSVAAIPQIIEKSIYIDSMPNNDSKVDAEKFDYYVCGLNIGRVNYTVRSVFVTLKDGTRYYDHKLTKIEKGKLLDSLFGTTPGFNQETSLASEYKDTKLISLLQANSSKVVDENGEPMVVYHGSLNDFKIFEYGKIRATRRAGFYFTRNKDLAKNYQKEGKLIEAFVNLRKPLNPDETKKEITKELFLEIANKAGIERDMNKLYDIADSDIDLVEFLISANNDIKAINDALYTVTKYDGIITEDRGLGRNYIAFSPNQIKSALENVGTFSSENDDIRYREEEVQSLKTKKVSIVSYVEELADTLHTPIRIVKSAEELSEEDVARKRIENGDGIKGWFDIKSEEMAIYLPNATSVEDARESVFHEVVGHYGLRKLFGEDFNTFLDNVYANVSPEIRKQIVNRAKEQGNILDLREATEEYLAALAERGFDNVEERTLWQKIKDAFIDMLCKAGVHLGFDLTDNELRYVLWRSYQNLESQSIMDRAADIDMQRRLRVGNFRENEAEHEKSPENYERTLHTVNEFAEKHIGAGSVFVVRSSEKMQEQLEAIGLDKATISNYENQVINEGALACYNQELDKIIIFNANAQIDEINAYLWHESVHRALRNLFGDKNADVIEPIYQWLESRHPEKCKAIREKYNQDSEDVQKEECVVRFFENMFTKHGAEGLKKIIDGAKPDLSDFFGKVYNAIVYGTEESADNRGSSRRMGDGSKERDGLVHTSGKESSQGETEKRFRTGEPTGEERRASGKVDKSTLSLSDSAFRMSKWEKIREAYQDGMISVKLMQDYLAQKTGKAIPEWMDVYLYENSKSGRSGYRMEQFHKKLYAPLMQEAGRLMQEDKNNGSSMEEAERLLDVYMKAKHGLEERNERMRREAMLKKINSIKDEDAKSVALQEMGESGIQDIAFSDESLEKFRVNLLLKDYSGLIGLAGKDENGNDKSMPEVERYAREAISTYEANHDTKKLWELVKDVSEYALKEEYEGGLIDKETYETIRDMYKYYIPLRGRNEKTAEDFFSYIERGASDTGFENVIKRAYGHTYESGNAFAYLTKMAETAIVQSEKNRVKQRLLWMARNYRDPSIMEIANVWYVKDSEGQWVEKVPELAGTEGEQKQAMIEFNQQMEELQKEGKAKRKLGKVDIGVPISTYQAQEHQVRVKENGREYVININADPRIAHAINGYGGNEGQLKILLDGIDWSVRNLAALNTSWNPEFAVGNIIRDLEYAAGSSFVKEGVRYAAKGAKNTALAVAAMQRYFWGKQNMSNQMDKYLQEFLANGGETGFTHLSNLNLHEKRAKKMLKRASRGKELRTGENIINQANRFIEMIPRFTTYVASRESGKSIISSVNDAKNITVNFNRRGSGRMADWRTDGVVVSLATFMAPVLSRMQMFANASIQGTANYFGSAKNHPVRWASTTASVAAMGVLSTIISNMLGGDDEPGYEDISEWVRHSNFTLFNGKNYFSLPLTMEYRPFYTLGESMAMVYLGKSDMKKAAKSVGVSMWDNWNPLSVELFKSGSPTPLLTPFYENLKDEDYKGSKITGRTSWNAYLPEYQRAKKGTGDVFMWVSEGLNDVTGGNKYERGWAQVNPSQLEHLVMGWSGGTGRAVSGLYEVIKSTIAGENPELERAPIVRRFYGKVTEENRYRRLKKEFMDKVTKANNLMKSLKRMQKDYENPLDYAERINEIYKDGEYEKAYNLIEDNKTLRDYEGYYNGSETQEEAEDVMKNMIEILEKALKE